MIPKGTLWQRLVLRLSKCVCAQDERDCANKYEQFRHSDLSRHALFVPSVPSALRTLAWEIPNWRAIREVVAPAPPQSRVAIFLSCEFAQTLRQLFCVVRSALILARLHTDRRIAMRRDWMPRPRCQFSSASRTTAGAFEFDLHLCAEGPQRYDEPSCGN